MKKKTKTQKKTTIRNLPQMVIQVLYIIDTGSFDIFVISAMGFGIVSIMVGISNVIAHQSNKDVSDDNQVYYYRVKNVFKIKIVCAKFKSVHKYTYKTMTSAMCDALGIDNAGNIEPFYIISIRHGLIAFVEVSDVEIRRKNSQGESGLKHEIFDNMLLLGQNGSEINTGFKEELNEKLKLLNLAIPGAINNNNNNTNESIGNKIQVFVEKDYKGLYLAKEHFVNLDRIATVATESESSVNIGDNSTQQPGQMQNQMQVQQQMQQQSQIELEKQRAMQMEKQMQPGAQIPYQINSQQMHE